MKTKGLHIDRQNHNSQLAELVDGDIRCDGIKCDYVFEIFAPLNPRKRGFVIMAVQGHPNREPEVITRDGVACEKVYGVIKIKPSARTLTLQHGVEESSCEIPENGADVQSPRGVASVPVQQ